LVSFAILAHPLRAASERGSRVARSAAVALLAGSLALVTFRLGAAIRGAVLDALVGVALVAFGVWLDAAAMRRVAHAGLVAWPALVIAGAVLMGRDDSLRRVLFERAPVVAAPGVWLGG
jgi:hypothetical protein